MDAAGIAAFLLAARQQDTRMAVATAMVKQKLDAQGEVLKMLDGGLANAADLRAAAPPGMGAVVDVTV